MTTATRPRAKSKAALAYQARMDAHLQATIALVTAMHNALERGDVLTDAQIAACFHDHTLGVLWHRIEDYCEYVSRRRRLHRVACDDRYSIAIDEHFRRFHAEVDAWSHGGAKPAVSIVEHVRRAALQ